MVLIKSLFLIVIIIFAVYFLAFRLFVYPSYDYHFYEGARKIAYLRLDAIVFGILADYLMRFYRHFLSQYSGILFFLGLGLFVLNQYLIFRDNYSNLYYFNTVYYTVLGLAFMLMFPFFKSLDLKSLAIKNAITFISKISYSLYLIHWLVFRFLEISFFSFLNPLIKFVLFFTISIAAASFTYYFIEKPVLKYRDNFVRR